MHLFFMLMLVVFDFILTSSGLDAESRFKGVVINQVPLEIASLLGH